MTPLVALGVAAAGGAGAVLRLLLDAAVSVRTEGRFPAGTLAVNLSGALLLGLLVGLAPGGDALEVAGTGLLGGYTTFSTWMFESHRLTEDGHGGTAVANLLGSLLLGLGCAAAGRALGTAL
ncbi:MAG: fluoride efflux transporter CrcB [Solirubrobacteraceae bacterium]